MHRFSSLIRILVSALLLAACLGAQAQKLEVVIQDKTLEDQIEEAGGLAVTRDGIVLVTSQDGGLLLRQDGEGFKSHSMTPEIFQDGDITGVAEMADGRLVFSNEGSSNITITDAAASKLVRSFSKSGGDAGELDDPKSIAASINRRIYVVERGNNRVSVFSDEGLFLQHMGAHDRDNRDLEKPTHMALDAEENVYVLEAGNKNRISVFSANGELLKQPKTADLGKLLGSKIDFSAMTADLNGTIYLADDNSKQVFAYDWRNDRILARFGTLGQSRGQFRNISLLAVNAVGKLAVLDRVNAKVEVYQLDDTEFASPVRSDTLKFAGKTASDCDDLRILSGDRFLCLKPDTESLVVLDAAGNETGPFAAELQDITAFHSGSQLVAILRGNEVYAYNHQGKQLFQTGRYGSGPGAFDKPKYIYTAHNQVYVGGPVNNRVQVFSSDGQFVTQIKGGSKNTFGTLGPLAVDSQKNIYVVDDEGARFIRVLSQQGELLDSIGDTEESAYRQKKVHALDIDRQDRLYAIVTSDANDYSVRVFQNGQRFLEFGAGDENGTPVHFETAGALSVSSTDKNSIYVHDTEAGQLFRFDFLEYPDAAFGLQVAGDKSNVELKWSSSKSPLIARYDIQAASSKTAPFETIAQATSLQKILTNSQARNLPWFRVVSVSGFGLEAEPSKPQRNQFYTIDQLYRAERYEDVITLSSRQLKISPDNSDILHLKAEAELASGQQQAAIASFGKLALVPRYKNLAIRKQVQAYYELEQYLDAKALIDQVLAGQPKDAEPYLICTELSIEIGDAIGAVTCAEDGLALHPDNPQLRYLLGKGYILAGILDQGLMEYQTVVGQNPNDHAIRLRIANDLMQLEQFAEALTHYEHVNDAQPANGQASVGRANALLRLDRDDEAKAIAVKLSAQKETQGEGYYVLGKIALKQEKYTEAVLRLTRAGKVAPGNVDTWAALAESYMALNQLPKAVTSLNQGIKNNPEAYQLYELAGKLELEQENYPQANELLDTAVTLNGRSLLANKLYARSLFASRNYRSAATYAERAARIAPKDIDVLTLQADIANRQGKIGSSIEYLKTAISIDSASPQLQYRLGRVYQDANLFDASREHLDRAAAINPSWADPHVALGQLFIKRRLFDEAIGSFEKAVELDPSDTNRAILNTAFAEKKKSLEFKSNAPQLQLADLNLDNVFSAAYKQYANASIGSVKVKNVSATEYGNLQLSFQIREYMDFPVLQEIPLIRGNETQQYDFKITFNNRILEVDEDTGVQVEVKLEFERDGRKDSVRLTQPMTIYGKNAMVWGNPTMVGSFVTPKDDPLRNYVREVINKYQPPIGPLNDKMVSVMTFFSSLTASGAKYVVDPNTPYSSLRDDQVDYVQFPRETLKLKSGDCDDLSVLFSAGLENLGIETVFLEVPGHLLFMFNSGVDEADAGLISRDSGLLAIRNGKVWIPLEATMVNASFSEAWAEGARKYHQALATNSLGIIDLKQAWQTYPPVTLRQAAYTIDLPEEQRITGLVKTAQSQLLTKSIDRLILPYQTMITNNPRDIAARMQIAILYARYGLYEDASIEFESLLELAPSDPAVHTNYGNLQLLSGNYDQAIASYQQAASLDEKDGGILVNLSMAHYRKGNNSQASSEFNRAVALDNGLKSKYSAYARLLSQ